MSRLRTSTAYREGAAGNPEENVAQQNEQQWQRWAIWPRALRGRIEPRVDTTVLGQPLALPVVAAPTAMHGLWHPQAEAETARGVHGAGSLLVLSQASTVPPEQAVTGPYLQQLYLPRNRELIVALLARARAAGAVGFVLTVDQIPLRRPQWFRSAIAELGVSPWRAMDSDCAGTEPADGFEPSDIGWLKQAGGLPVLVKGILHPDDAVTAVQAGADGIVVSNHGGRQLADSVTPAEVLALVAAAVDGAVPVHVDSGIRTASDVFRALCLGADTAWVGRPILRNLETGGAAAVSAWLDELRDELLGLFALAGVRSPAECHPGLLRERHR